MAQYAAHGPNPLLSALGGMAVQSALKGYSGSRLRGTALAQELIDKAKDPAQAAAIRLNPLLAAAANAYNYRTGGGKQQ